MVESNGIRWFGEFKIKEQLELLFARVLSNFVGAAGLASKGG